MNNKQLSTICNYLNLGKPTASLKKVEGGLLHLMWRVDTDKGSYAIKQLSKNINLTPKVRSAYEVSEKTAHEFASHGIPAIAGIEQNGKFLVDADAATFIVYPWVDAKIFPQDRISVAHAVKIAALLAKIHLLNLTVPAIASPEYDIHSNEEILSLIDKSLEFSLPFANKLQQAKSMLIEINDQYQKAVPLFKNIAVVTHADLDQKNVLWDEQNNPILIDWESLRAINPTYEFLIAALDWSGATAGKLNEEIFLAMFGSYKKAGGKIDLAMLNANFYGIPGNCISWIVYNIRRSFNTKYNSLEEQRIGIAQVNQVIDTMSYLENKIKDLKILLEL